MAADSHFMVNAWLLGEYDPCKNDWFEEYVVSEVTYLRFDQGYSPQATAAHPAERLHPLSPGEVAGTQFSVVIFPFRVSSF
jgi:hypothetical protein